MSLAFRLSVTRGHDGHAEVDQPAFVPHAETAVLRHAALGDIELAHDSRSSSPRKPWRPRYRRRTNAKHAQADVSGHVDHAKDDIATRALLEARTEGEQLLETTEKFIQKNAKELDPAELVATAEAMQALQLSLTMEDKDLIHTKIEELNDISRPYAERVMDQAVSKAMKGKAIS